MQSITFDWPGLAKKEINLAKDLQKWVNAQNVELPTEQVNILLKILRNVKSLKMFHPQLDEDLYKQLLSNLNQTTFKIQVKFQEETYQFSGTKNHQRELASLVKGSEFYLVKELNRNEISVMSKDDFKALFNALKNIK